MRYRFVDCRWSLDDPGLGRRQYLDGHIPGAVFVDVEQDLSAPPGAAGRHPLPTTEQFTAAASRCGIEPGVFVVAYGSTGGAERLWWLLRHYGHDDCAVIDLADLARAAAQPARRSTDAGTFVPVERTTTRSPARSSLRTATSSSSSTPGSPPAGAASRTRPTGCQAGSRAR